MTSTLDLNNIQGDILSGLPKKTQTYVFFQISHVDRFRTRLALFVPLVKTVSQVIKDRQAIGDHKRKHKGDKPGLIPMVGVNIAFSSKGLAKMGIKDDLQDDAFAGGQLKDAKDLGDNGSTIGTDFIPDWEKPFLEPIHGLIFLSGDSHRTIDHKLREVERIFGVGTHHPSIHEVIRIRGDVRPGAESGHEHFGFEDGISNPAVQNFDTTTFPGQETVPTGIILAGRSGDSRPTRPAWMLDGSFLTFRYLFQKVPEFDEFLQKNSIDRPGLTKEEGSALLGARLVGRWKSGAPVDLTPLTDDPELAADPQRNNNFRFQGEVSDQVRCPFAAHIRKTNPRADLEDHNAPTTIHRIIRRGIQFGPEVSDEECREAKTHHGRGLLFVSYSSSVTDGFQFVQKSWANDSKFPPFETTPAVPGMDPIIGQAGGGALRSMSGTIPDQPLIDLALPEFVVPRGGEYFFSPSISALRDTLAESVRIQ